MNGHDLSARRSTSVGRTLLSAVIALAALAGGLAIGAVPAFAAPTLAATPNPVPVPFGDTTAQFTLTWDSGDGKEVELVIARSGQPPDPPVKQPTSGSELVDISVAEIVTVTMQPVGGGRPLTRPLTVTAIASGPPDVIDCTVAVCAYENSATVHGTWATITTGVADVKQVTVEVTDPNGKVVVTTPMNVAGGVATADVFGLSAQTKYDYVIRVLDNLGNTTDELSSVFVTLERNVELTFTDFVLLDDSDDLTDAELDIWFTVGPVDWAKWNSGRLSWGTGHTETLGAATTVTAADDVMPFAFFIEDDDTDITSGLCSQGPQVGGTGEDGCYSWITVGGAIDSTGHTGANEAFTTSFVFAGSNDDDLAFTVGYVADISYK